MLAILLRLKLDFLKCCLLSDGLCAEGDPVAPECEIVDSCRPRLEGDGGIKGTEVSLSVPVVSRNAALKLYVDLCFSCAPVMRPS